MVTVLMSFTSTKVYKQDLLDLDNNLYSSVVARFIMGFFSDILLFIAFTFTTYSKGICLFFTNTLMIPFFAGCFLGEKIKKIDIVAILLSFVGMIMIIQPLKGGDIEVDIKKDMIGVAFALGSAITGALAVIYNKKTSSRVHHSKMCTYYTFANCIFCPIWSFL